MTSRLFYCSNRKDFTKFKCRHPIFIEKCVNADIRREILNFIIDIERTKCNNNKK